MVDPEGRGVEGLEVRVVFKGRHSSGYARVSVPTDTKTDNLGRFRMDAFEAFPDGWADVKVRAPGWVQPRIRRVSSREMQRSSDSESCRTEPVRPLVRVVLERGQHLTGFVETEAHSPVPGYEVRGVWRDELGTLRVARVCTDPWGHFDILVPASVHLGAIGPWCGEDAPLYFPIPFMDETEAVPYRGEAWNGPVEPGSLGQRLVLRERVSFAARVFGPDGPYGGDVEIRIVDLEHPDRGIPGQLKFVSPERDLPLRLSPGIYDIEFLPNDQGCLPVRSRVTVPGHDIEVRFPPAVSLVGRVEGTDVRQFTVTWTGSYNPGFRPLSWCPTRDCVNGTTLPFEIHAVADAPGSIYAHREGDRRCAFISDYVPSRGPVHLVLREGETIAGLVEASTGSFPSDLRVEARRGVLSQSARVLEDGRFEIVGLPPGQFDIELSGQSGVVFDRREGVDVGAHNLLLHLRPHAEGGGSLQR